MRYWLLLVLILSAPLRADELPDIAAGDSITAVIDAYRAQGYPFIYSSTLLGPTLKVEAAPRATDALGRVREILAPHGLTIREEADAYLIVRSVPAKSASLLLVITAGDSENAIAGPRVRFDPEIPAAREIRPGVFELDDVEPGRYTLSVEADGFAAARERLNVRRDDTRVINVVLQTARPEIETIAVTASRYELSRDVAPSTFSIDQRSIETLPDIGDDPLRAVQRLPGAAASGASAKTHLRGGDNTEVGIVLNGHKLFDPFHVRDYQSIFSAIDSRALEGIEVYTGGFPVRYGNRMSGMVLMESLDPLTPRHTELGLSVYNTSFLTAGNEADKSWLVSARRGNLDLVINPDLGSPSYYDVFGEYAFRLTPNTSVSVNGLFASDRVEIVLETDPSELERVVSETDNAQLWIDVATRWSDTLSSRIGLSATWFDSQRRGVLGDAEKILASVFDDRQVLQYGFRQDFLYSPSDRHHLQWGLSVRRGNADYYYQNAAEYFELQAMFEGYDEPRSRSLAASPDGAAYALYLADRWKLSDRAVLEWGLRWDDQSYTTDASDAQLSPRISVLRRIGEKSELRLSWGRYHQAQEINELQIEDGITEFWPAQRADHFIVGFRHLFNDKYALRLEIFEKDIRDVQPRFENLFDPLGLIPEVQPDRIRLDPESARTRGLEITLDRSDGPLTWWATYVLSDAVDRIDGRDVRRSWDQRHAFTGGINYSGDRWEFGIAANVHSGWPLTELALLQDGVDEDGEPEFIALPGARNAGRHDVFASLDLRLSRRWDLPRGRLSAFLEISNALNRRNPCCLDWDLTEDETTGEEILERGRDYWMPLLPAIGVLWEF